MHHHNERGTSVTPDEYLNHDSADDSYNREGISRRGVLKFCSGLLGLLAWPWRTARAAESAPLRVKFIKGQTLRYAMTIENKMQGSANGREFSQGMTNDTVFTWKVLNVSPEGMATIEQANERSRLAMKNPGLEIDLDTAKPADDKEGELPEELTAVTDGLRKMVGKPIELTVNPRGEIERINFSQELLDAIGMTQEFMQFGFNRDKPLKRLGELGLIELPAKPLGVGESTEEPRSVHSPLAGEDLRYVFKYTRQPAESVGGRELARVDYVVEFDTASLKAMGARKYEVNGRILLDEQKGVIVRIDFEQQFGLDLGEAIEAAIGDDPGIVKGKNEQTVTRTTRLLAADEDPFADKQGD
jgi:hypothetical protein